MRLYLDGCSLTYGQGLPKNQTLSSLFREIGGYTVLDKSFPGKSNISICFDAYQHRSQFDIFVLGFTFSDRFGLRYQNQDLQFYAGSKGLGFDLEPMDLDISQIEIQKYFFSIFGPPYSNELSDMLIDTTIGFLKKDKTTLAFSWEKRNTENLLLYPFISFKDRLPDGHLNHSGTKKLFDYLQNELMNA